MKEPELSDAEYGSLFRNQLCGLSTASYILDDNLTKFLTPLIAEKFDKETELLKSRMASVSGTPEASIKNQLRVALSNIALAGFAGSELWTMETARFLSSIGLEVIVHSPKLGEVAKLISDSNIAVTSSVDEVVDFSPSLLHVNHFEAAQPLVDRLIDRVWIVNMVHGLLPRPGLPGQGNVDLYCSASIVSKAKIHVLTKCTLGGYRRLAEFLRRVPLHFDRKSVPTRTRLALLEPHQPRSSRETAICAVVSWRRTGPYRPWCLAHKKSGRLAASVRCSVRSRAVGD